MLMEENSYANSQRKIYPAFDMWKIFLFDIVISRIAATRDFL